MPLQATSGAASYDAFGGGVPVVPTYIEDVFSTYLYTGNGSTQTITNGIDLSTKGGLVWQKDRTTASTDHILCDTARGVNAFLRANGNFASVNNGGTDAVYAFNTNGFSTGSTNGFNINLSGDATVSWTFAKAPKFFDVLTYTGTGSNTTIAHSLGSVPACIIVKRTDTTGAWQVYHRSLANTEYLVLNSTAAAATGTTRWNSTTPTSTVFSLGTDATVNASGGTYVAYIFAHDAGGFGLTGTDNVISCGSYVGDGTTNKSKKITLGYEPQFIIMKPAQAAPSGFNGWNMLDIMRGIPTGGFDLLLTASNNGPEDGTNDLYDVEADGFRHTYNGTAGNDDGITYIYIAIRRGPMKVPTSGTSVFYPNAVAQANSPDSSGVPFPPDLINTFSRDGTNRTNKFSFFQFVDRLRGAGTPNDTRVAASEGKGLVASGTDAEYGQSGSLTYVQLKANSQDITHGTGWNSTAYGNWIHYFWRRAPSFMDVVCYTGTGSSTTFNHNLGVVPELMIVKRRSTANAWAVYANNDNTDYLVLNTDAATVDDNTYWNDTSPTSSVFSVGTNNAVNASASTYVAYLFATCAGVSKVGSYTGTATTKQIDCGFTGGARFVLIKRTDTTGDWYVWDTARGIVSGDDPYLLPNSTDVEVTNTDYIDTYSAGFELSSTAPAAINASGGTYIFLAIA
jgi:hypothetical protein